MARKTKAEADLTRQAILDAAEQCFAETGVAGVSLGQIAQRARVTRGAIYWHFRGKADIVAEALRRLRAAGADTSRPVLIGDRHHDVEGGAAQGVPVIFVRWGFSWPHESEGATAAVDDVDALRALLLIED